MTTATEVNLIECNLKLEHFYPHYLDETGIENAQLLDSIAEILTELPSHIQLRGGYVCCSSQIEFTDNYFIQVDNQAFNAGKVVYQMLKKSTQFCFFLCTAGAGITEWSRRLFAEGDFLKGYLVDMAGSLLVDQVADQLSEKIEQEAATKGLSCTNRYSPGYCDWHVSEQQKLFGFFPSGFCGVNLTPTSLMIPEKSISGLIGAGTKCKKVPYTCSMCDMKDCMYSKTKRTN